MQGADIVTAQTDDVANLIGSFGVGDVNDQMVGAGTDNGQSGNQREDVIGVGVLAAQATDGPAADAASTSSRLRSASISARLSK